jgi:hypothetical protein
MIEKGVERDLDAVGISAAERIAILSVIDDTPGGLLKAARCADAQTSKPLALDASFSAEPRREGSGLCLPAAPDRCVVVPALDWVRSSRRRLVEQLRVVINSLNRAPTNRPRVSAVSLLRMGRAAEGKAYPGSSLLTAFAPRRIPSFGEIPMFARDHDGTLLGQRVMRWG